MPKSKKKLIIKSSSSTKSNKSERSKRQSNNPSKKPKKEPKKAVTKRKKKLLIIESSSTSSPKKEKIDSLLSQKTTVTEQEMLTSETNLKKTQENKSITMSLPTGRLNENFIELMEKLADIMLKQGEPFRARAYQKAQETIMAYPDDILSPSNLKGKPNIGPTIMDKLNEYVETGTLKVIEREKNNPVNILAEVYGIGPKKAKELVEKGITNIAELRERPELLNDVQKIGLRYYEDVLKRIPRSEIDDYKELLNPLLNPLLKKVEQNYQPFSKADDLAQPFSKAHHLAQPFSKADDLAQPFPKVVDMEIVGSYRRGAATSGDIDIIITSQNEEIFKNFIDELIKQKVILEVLSRGPSKCLVMAKIPSSDTVRRVDFLYTKEEEFPFAILYFTGSKIFNTVMRQHALQMGLTMNEHGLYKMENGKKGEKVAHKFKSEKDIFDYLNMEYKSPNERIDGRALVLKTIVKKPPAFIIEESSSSLEAKPITEVKLVEEPITLKPKKSTKKATNAAKKTKKNLVIEEDLELAVEEPLVQKEELDKNAIEIADKFKKNGIKILEDLNEAELSNLLREANKAYYNEEPFLTDNEFDIVKEFIEKKYPSAVAVADIGAPVERNKVKLPYFMGSMDKIKPDTNALQNWKTKYKGPYVLSCKLDGVSGLYTTEGTTPKLYTRGDGKVGQDISHLIPHLRLPKTKGIVIRGEFIIPKEVFDKKYKSKFANPRNMVSGIVNHKTISDAIKDVHFVAYELLKPVKKPSEQMTFLQTLDVETVLYRETTDLTNELLSETLVEWRKSYIYEIDGVIVTNDGLYERKTGNPEHAFAFKMVLSDQVAEAKVVDVIWSPSKDGYLKPRVQIEPINLGGVRIEYATGFNGAFIKDNKVGVGAVIELIRSGDVIPHIRKVTMPATEAKMPTVPYKWNDTHIDIMLEDVGSDETVKEKVITGFFRGINVEGLSSGNIARIIQAGFDTVPAILKMTKEDLLSVEGFKEKTAEKLFSGIREKIETAPLVTIMAASNLFGRGFSDKKLELIMSEYPDVLLSKEPKTSKILKVVAIKGMATKTAEAFVERIPEFLQFLKDANLEKKLSQVSVEKPQLDQSHPLYNKSVVMTGFRDKELEDKLKSLGAKLGSSVSKNTFVVLVKDLEEDTGKANDAKKIGVPLMTPDSFIKKYGL
jgi:NAD-dependent DNA ligase/DNA polymerase/3'-5' exonuclease PolX